MRYRQYVFFKSTSDTCCFMLCFIFIPITIFLQLKVILPEIHLSGLLYWSTAVLGVFLAFNVVTNFLACIFVDTSIRANVLKPPEALLLRGLWHFCFQCKSLVPPRSWHCQICRTCILKRDHHCMFTGCCIGHYNYRYFFFFITYLAIGSACSSIYSSIYLWKIHADIYANELSLLEMVFPFLMLTVDLSWKNIYLLIYELNLIAFIYSVTLIYYHIPSILVGAISYEKKSLKYDKGLKTNVEMIFGKRMHLTWISPFIKSDLPHDGIHWNNFKGQSSKHN